MKEEETKEKPFEGKKVYFSGSIRGAKTASPELLWSLVQYMKENGADVLSEHVAALTKRERDEIFSQKAAVDLSEEEEPWRIARKVDFAWVNQADYVVAEITSLSFGVGMELQRAIDKEELGFNHTKILCLYRADLINEKDISWMFLGVSPDIHSDFFLKGYKSLKEAEEIVAQFLTDSLNLEENNL